MNNEVQPIANPKTGQVAAYSNPTSRFAVGPSRAEIEARNNRFKELESADPAKAPKVETGVWAPRTDEVMTGFFLGFATLARNPNKPEDITHLELMQSKINGDDEEVADMAPEYKAYYLSGKIPYPAVAIDTKTGLRYISRMDAMTKFQSGQVAQDEGVYIKCIHEKQGEMTKFEIRPLDVVTAVDTEYTEA